MANNQRASEENRGSGSFRVQIHKGKVAFACAIAGAFVLMLALALWASFVLSAKWAFVPWLVSSYLASVLVVRVSRLRGTTTLILQYLPGFKEALDHQERLRENELIERTLMRAVEVYEIEMPPESKLAGLAKTLLAFENRDQRIRKCCQEAARRLASGIPADDLEIFFYDVEGEVPPSLWPSPDPPARRRKLAGTLLKHSGRFDRWKKELALDSETLAEILGLKDRYRLGGMEANLQRIKGENDLIERTLARAMEVYRIEMPTFTDQAKPLPAFIDRERRIRDCCQNAAERLLGNAVLVADRAALADDLQIFFYDVEGKVPPSLWPSPDPPARRRKLAGTLLEHSGRFERWKKELALKPDHLAEILGWKDQYRLGDLEADLDRTTDLWRTAGAFHSFLVDNDLPPDGPTPNLSNLLETLRAVSLGTDPRLADPRIGALNPLNQARLLTLIDLGRPVMRSVPWTKKKTGGAARDGAAAPAAGPGRGQPLAGAEPDLGCLLSLAIFFTRTSTGRDLKPVVCSLLALLPAGQTSGSGPRAPYHNPGVQLSWEYLKTKQEFRNGLWKKCSRPYLSLGQFFPEWNDQHDRTAPGVEEELGAEYRALLDGSWPAHREDLLQDLFVQYLYLRWGSRPHENEPAKEARPAEQQPSQPPLSPSTTVSPDVLLTLFPSVRKALAGNLDLSTVERFLESKTVIPYLITLGPSSLPLSRLLDCLTSEKKRKSLTKKEIKIRGEYSFERYTPYCRVGIVPKGMSFEAFARGFHRDVETLIRATRDGMDDYYEILLHTFNPAAYNPFGFGRPKAGRAAEQRIKDLFARALSERELDQMVAYDLNRRLGDLRRLGERILQAPLARPARGWQGLSDDDRRALEQADRPVKEEFLAELAKAGLDPLWVVDLASRPWRYGVDLLAGLIRQHVRELAPELCRPLAEAYLDFDNLWFYVTAASDGELADPTPVLRELEVDAPARRWHELSASEHQTLKKADERIKRRFIERLGIEERKLLPYLDRPGEHWKRAVEELGVVVGAEVPSLAAPTRERLAQAYLEALRRGMKARAVELARVHGLLVQGSGAEPPAAAA